MLRAMSALSLLAAPTFAVMALVTAVGGGPTDAFCGTSPLGGMATMYLLMSVFHAAPWIRLFLPSFAGEVSAKRTCLRLSEAASASRRQAEGPSV